MMGKTIYAKCKLKERLQLRHRLIQFPALLILAFLFVSCTTPLESLEGGAVVLSDESLARDLLPAVRGLLQDPVRLLGMAEAMSGTATPDAAEAIAFEVANAAKSGPAAGRSSPENGSLGEPQ